MKSLHLLQAEYWQSPVSLEGARSIVASKCRNMDALLHTFSANRLSDRKTLTAIRIEIQSIILRLSAARDRQQLMLCEAQATKAYWKGFGIICRCSNVWRRSTKSSNDPWNQTLAVGYHRLYAFIRETIRRTTMLVTDIGILHSSREGVDALVYDFAELFRQPIVDRTVMTLFSRRRNPASVTLGLVVAKMTRRWTRKNWYCGKLVDWQTILESEIMALKRAIIQGKPYIPHSMPWTHRSKRKRPV